MRVTTQMMVERSIQYLEENRSRLDELQQRAASGKVLQSPSDDPALAVDVLGLRASLRASEAYRSTAAETSNWLDANEVAFGQLVRAGQRALDMGLQGLPDTLSDRERAGLRNEMEGVINNAVDAGNSNHHGRYIFSGFQVNTVPYSYTNGAAAVTENVTNTIGPIQHSITPGTTVTVNFDGNGLLRPLYQALAGVRDALQPGNSANLGAARTALQAALNTVVDARTANGARQRNVDDTVARMQQSETALRTLLSEKEDTSLGEVVMHLKQQETAYQAVLGVAGRVNGQPSLFDFLR